MAIDNKKYLEEDLKVEELYNSESTEEKIERIERHNRHTKYQENDFTHEPKHPNSTHRGLGKLSIGKKHDNNDPDTKINKSEKNAKLKVTENNNTEES